MHILKTLGLGWLMLLSCALDSLSAEVAIVTIFNRETTYNGNPQGVTIEAPPQGIPVGVLFDGYGYSESLPTGAGYYAALADKIEKC